MWSSCARRSSSSISSRQRHVLRAVDQAELDGDVAVAAEHRLQHQELVEVGVEQRADDRVDPPVVVVDAGGDVGHGAQPISLLRTKATPASPIAASAAAWRAVEVDLAAGVLDERDPEAEPRRVERRVGDAEVGGEPGEPDRADAAVAQVAGEAGRRSRGRSRRRPSSCRRAAGSPCAGSGRRRRSRGPGGRRRPACPARNGRPEHLRRRRASRSSRRAPRPDGSPRRSGGRARASPGCRPAPRSPARSG